MSEQGSEYAGFIKEELAAEEARRETVNSRAVASITTSGTQFGIVTGLVVFLHGKDWLPRHGATWVFATALGLYLVSVCFGLIATQSHKTEVADPKTLREMLGNRWTDRAVDARNIVAGIKVSQIEALRAGTDTKSNWLKRSVTVQIAAVAALAVAVILVTGGTSSPSKVPAAPTATTTTSR